MRTITRLYNSYGVARTVVALLETEHVPYDQISLVAPGDASATTGPTTELSDTTSPTDVGTSRIEMASDDEVRANAGDVTDDSTGAGLRDGGQHSINPTDPQDISPETGATTGAVVGSVLGSGAGLLAGIGALAIPGVGPVVAAGWLVATLAGAGVGAGAGGLVGSLTSAGLSPEEADAYGEAVHRGGSWVSVRVPEERAPEIAELMDRYHPISWREHRAASGPDWRVTRQTA